MEIAAHKLTKPPLHAVSRHRRPHCPADYKSYLRCLIGRNHVHKQMTDQRRPTSADAVADGARKLSAPSHPGRGRKDQALSFSRPLRLRAASTARPARVRMRSRKPCVFARCRLFGWNVRLLTVSPRSLARGPPQGGVFLVASMSLLGQTPPRPLARSLAPGKFDSDTVVIRAHA